jgi:UDP-glucose 4-epimerase
MSTVLVTGASGFVAGRLIPDLARRHEVIAISRKPAAGAHRAVAGDFGAFEDLRQLDRHRFDAVIHLAAEVGGTSEEAGLSVNVLGTRRLLRYLADRGCRRFVMASSIAAVGCLHPDFVPAALPMPDRHPCLARDAYGLSKALAEDVADYFARLLPDAMCVNLRFGLAAERVQAQRGQVPWLSLAAPPAMPFLYFGYVAAADMVGGLVAALEAPARPGARVYNLVAPDIRCTGNVADVLRAKLGDRLGGLDLAPFERPGAACPPVYASAAIAAELGYTPRHSVAAPGSYD